ncbi:TPA: phage tail protein [Pseudomonas aeruginosa]|uniref:phage tail-collar fiber domain-containing protein n=1 Tax=Pseudomonas aeruginosa TaxID=287 RepID=UPI00053E7A68|nr:phage tail protein [Pseudomonas aeruginosa]MBI9143321.1 phage tail protein [Pseudomonas aeruginosa]MCA4039503.1 phage tail protein [Pseudomonas aeruginosa]HBP5723537.1 phage tail protein [Pseudomonas aeruginosa]HCF4870516.1 phage tail protein [Pseudomonas aeruginosa]HCK0559567.1 phage tail protein [Pseudomonas aeruginosa]
MSKQYGGFLTDKGAAKQIEAAAGGLRRDITHMLIGDGGGAPGETPDPVPSPSQTALIRQRYRVKLNRLVAAEDSPSVLVAEAILPQEVGGWWMRELGLEDSDGDLIAVADCAPSYKPLVSEGAGRTQTVRLHIAVSHAEIVNLLIDPNVVTATVADLNKALLEVRAINDATGQMTLEQGGGITLPLSLSPTGVAPGTYRSLTVDAKGRATSGSNPTTLGGYGITDALAKSEAVEEPTPHKLLRLNGAGQLPASITGNAASATKLTSERVLACSGAATGSAVFDGTRDVSIALTLADSGVVPGVYPKVTINAKGLVTAGASLSAADIPSLDWSKINSGKPTTLAGYGITDALNAGFNSQSPIFYSAVAGDGLAQAAIQIREAELIGANGRIYKYAPRLWFHWSGVYAGDLGMNDVGNLLWRGSPIYTAANLDLSVYARVSHTHDASQITSGILPVHLGGTGANNSTGARESLGAGVPSTAWLYSTGWWRDNDTGFIRQWGRVTVAGDGTATITFPIPFPNECLGGFAGQTAYFHPGTDASTAFYGQTTTGATLENSYQLQSVLFWEAFGR